MGEHRVATGSRAAGLPETSYNSSDQSPLTTHLLNYLIIYVVVSKLTTHTIAENSFYQIEFSTCVVFLLLFILQAQILSNDKSEASPPIFPKDFHALLTKSLWSSSAFLGYQGILFCFVFSQSYAKFYSCFSYANSWECSLYSHLKMGLRANLDGVAFPT